MRFPRPPGGIIILAIAVLPGCGWAAGGCSSASFRDTARSSRWAPASWPAAVEGVCRPTGAGALALAVVGWTGLDPAMNPFQAFSYTTSAVALGGFAPRADSARGLAPVTQWIIYGLMVVACINFLRLHRLLVLRQARAFARDQELRLYLALLALGSIAIGIELFAGADRARCRQRHAGRGLPAVSVMTTTGLATLNWTKLGPLVTLTLLLLMFVGASSGSTTGSIKVVRHLMLSRLARRELQHAVHPQIVVPVRVSGTVIEESVLHSVVMFVLLYLFVFALGALSLVLDARRTGGQFGAFEALGAAASCLGNVGPAFGSAGPFGSYAGFTDLSKVMLTIMMLPGRVEIVPIAVLFTRSFWRR